MNSKSIPNINGEIKKRKALLDIVASPNFEKQLETLKISWLRKSVDQQSTLASAFMQENFIDSDFFLTKSGLLFCSRVCIDYEHEILKFSPIDNKYNVLKTINKGKNSVTFLAEHKDLGTKVVLKFLRPGAAENVVGCLRLISELGNTPNLIQPIDFITVKLTDIFGSEIINDCIIFPYIEGTLLRDFLKKKLQPLNAHTIASFIYQVGGVLAKLDEINAYHGDLHEDNLIVNTSNSGTLTFNVIDVSFGITGSSSELECKNNDLSQFRQHVWNILAAQQSFLAKMSVRKYLGSEIFSIVSTVLSSNTKSFREINTLFKNNVTHRQYLKKKKDFLSKKFSAPEFFKLQRYEEITDPSVALKLFVPFQELMSNIKTFCNAILSGNRGSGKSTYLAALGFSSSVESPIIDYKETFGIYFPCRQGEFRVLSSDMVDYSTVGSSRVKHLMILKIVRRTLEAIADGVESNKLKEPQNYLELKELLSLFLSEGEIISLDKNVVSEIRNIVSAMVRIEMKELDSLFEKSSKQLSKHLFREPDLIRFFEILKSSFIELSRTRFHLLFDDAGTPNIPIETQRIINDLMISSNPVFCIKISTEKYSYSFESSDSKQLESGHDFFEYDISTIFFTGSKSFGLDQNKLSEYCKGIIEKRLEYFDYESNDILDYLGDDPAKVQSIANSLATSRRNAYYCGWTMAWMIADRTPRNLLELVSEIFSVANIDKNTKPEHIPNRFQDRAIRAVSEKRLRSLTQISGATTINGIKTSLGRKIYDITSSIGSVYRIYLKSQPGKKRKDQYLAIERNDSYQLSDESQILLRELVKYGVFDESRLDFARDDMAKKPLYVLNRIFCPTFGLGLRRDQHLRLSRGKFEQLLLYPEIFIKDGTKRLRNSSLDNSLANPENDLFGNKL